MKLLVAALESELVAFPPEIAGFDRLVTGPGKLRGGVALARALEQGTYDEIVVVGTAGATDDALESAVYEPGSAVQHDVNDLDGIVGQHVSMPQRVTFGSGDVVIATGDSFVDDEDAVVGIRKLGGGLVDMEAYAYAWVAGEFGIPIRIFKAVSDRAQDDALVDWRATVTRCSGELWARFQQEY